jgi:8-oxo-dGTP diphosphatase
MVHTVSSDPQSPGVLEKVHAGIGDCINLIVTDQYRELLLLQKRDVWILPGGKPEGNETDQECLERELREELPNFRWSFADARYWRTFTGITPHSHREIVVRTYLLEPGSTYVGNVGGYGAEITDTKWLSPAPYRQVPLSDITLKIVNALRAESIIS